MASSVRDYLHARLEALLADCDPIMNSADFGQTIHDLDECLPCRLIKARNDAQRNDGIVRRTRFDNTDPVIVLHFIPGFCFAKGKCGKKSRRFGKIIADCNGYHDAGNRQGKQETSIGRGN